MRLEPQGRHWLIARDHKPTRYFCFLVDHDKACWSKYRSRARAFRTREQANGILDTLRARAKGVRELGLPRKPKPLAEYTWKIIDKVMLIAMARLGCKWTAIAVQTGRTAAACNAMYHMMQRNGEAAKYD